MNIRHVGKTFGREIFRKKLESTIMLKEHNNSEQKIKEVKTKQNKMKAET